MGTKRNLDKKKETDRAYRRRMVEDGGEEYREKKRNIDRVSWNKRKGSMEPRNLRVHRRSRREYMRQYRMRKANQKVEVTIINLDYDEGTSELSQKILSPRSTAATIRERRKLQSKMDKTKQENMKLKKSLGTVKNQLRRLKRKYSRIAESSQNDKQVKITLKSPQKTKLAVSSYFTLLKKLKRNYVARRQLSSVFVEVCAENPGAQSQLALGLHAHPSTFRKCVSHVERTPKVITNVYENFYCRDDNSRLCPGKKDTITRGKVKKQVI
jgi:hypothetical protein